MTDKTLQQLDEEEIDIETILPYGGMIQSVVAGSQLSKSDLKRMLAKRGIFTSTSEKEHTVPLLMSLLFTPREFEFLREQQRSKEDVPKTIERTLTCEDNDFSLLDTIAGLGIPPQLISSSSSYKVLETPRFIPKDSGNIVIMEYKIQRRNRTKDWAHNKSVHSAVIEFKKIGNEINVTLDYTAPETKELNDKLFRHVEAKLVESGVVSRNKKAKQICFGDFTNEHRIKFLLSLTNIETSGLLNFKQVTDIDIGPDPSQVLPKPIEWIRRVKTMLLKGEQLHLTELVTDQANHESLIIESIEAEYDFTFKGSNGTCKIEYGFPGSLSAKEPSVIEFEAKVKSFKFNSGEEQQPKKNAQRFLQSTFNDAKSKRYKELTMKSVAAI